MFQTSNQIVYSLISGTAPPSTHLVTLSFDSLRTSFVAPVPKLHPYHAVAASLQV